MDWISDPSLRHRVLLVDDDGDLRTLVRLALEISGRFEVVGEASDGRTALELVATRQPQLVVVDLGLPDVTGFDLIPRIHKLVPTSRIVIFSGREAVSEAQMSTLPGGTRFVLKGDVDRLIGALDVVAASADVAQSAAQAFSADPESASRARQFVADTCQKWGCEVPVDEVRLIVSELVTNALEHAGSEFEVRVSWTDRLLRLEVRDGSADNVPNPQEPSETAERGRGLLVVSALSHSWGIEPANDGKVVWAEMRFANN